MKTKKTKKQCILFLAMFTVFSMLFQLQTVKADTFSYDDKEGVVIEDAREERHVTDENESSHKELPKLDAPTGVEWDYDSSKYSIRIKWNANPDATNGYRLEYLRDGVAVAGQIWSARSTSASVGFFIEECNESGEYTIRIKCRSTDTHEASDWVTLEAFQYKIPDAILDTPSDVYWDGTIVKWKPVENADGYRVFLYRDGKRISSILGDYGDCQENWEWKMTEDGVYTAEVQAISKDINARHSSKFAVSPEYVKSSAPVKLSQPENLSWSETNIGVLTWDAVQGATGYEYEIEKDAVLIDYGITNRNSLDLTPQFTNDGEGSYTVKIRAVGEGNTEASDYAVSTPYEVNQNLLVKAFVSRLYLVIMNREADAEGLEAWTNQLIDKVADGAEIVAGFVGSEEFMGRGLSNEEVVEIMYLAMLGRSSDEAGKAAWTKILENGCSDLYIVNGFSGSQEFGGICNTYGINAGTVELTNPRDVNPDLTGFVTRCYVESLGRRPDIDGLDDWCSQLLIGEETPKNVAYGFVFSPETLEKNLDDSSYLDMLYRLCLGREADEEGKSAWLKSLQEESREQVFWGFANSPEFEEILVSFGLNE